jgi:hypothetical protein
MPNKRTVSNPLRFRAALGARGKHVADTAEQDGLEDANAGDPAVAHNERD